MIQRNHWGSTGAYVSSMDDYGLVLSDPSILLASQCDRRIENFSFPFQFNGYTVRRQASVTGTFLHDTPSLKWKLGLRHELPLNSARMHLATQDLCTNQDV